MSEVRIRIGPASYTVRCEPGEEEKIARLGQIVNDRYARLGTSRAMKETQNLVFASLFLADDFSEAEARIAAASIDLTEARTELQRARDDGENALRRLNSQIEQDKARASGKKAELLAEIETLRKAEERTRKDNARLKAQIAELEEKARHQHDLFGGPADDAAHSDALAEKLEALAARAERTASELEARAGAS